MKQYPFFTLVFLLFSTFSLAQKETNIWYFGDKAGLDFNSGVPVSLSDGQMNTFEGCAAISDSNGSLLFYTDGSSIWNRNHENMLNGNGLLGDSSSTNSAIIVPKIGQPNVYYIFTVGTFMAGINYSEVDMTLDNGLGAINSVKNILLQANTTEKLTAVKKKNANGYWVVGHKFGSNEFVTFNVSSSGVNLTPIISSAGLVHNARTGAIKISPDGTKLLSAMELGGVQLFDFNAVTGVVFNPIVLDLSASSYGVEFSPDSKFAYIQNKPDIEQFDLSLTSATDIINSKVIVSDSFVSSSAAIQQGPDGKIYIAKALSTFLHVINNPNEKGINCNFQSNGVIINSGRVKLGLPSFIQSFFSVGVSFNNQCFGDATQFSLSSVVDSVIWDFGDPISGLQNTSTEITPYHAFSSVGIYTVRATVTLGLETEIFTVEVEIFSTPIANSVSDINICDTDITNEGVGIFNLDNQKSTILDVQTSSEFEIDFFRSQTDADENQNKISNPDAYPNNTPYSEIIVARIHNKNNTSCYNTTTFNIKVFDNPYPQTPENIPNFSFCDNTSVGTDTDGKIMFNLKDRETTILNGQSAANFLVTYFEDTSLTQFINNPTTYTNLSTPQRIYCKVENSNNGNCLASTSFLLEVFELPIINSPVSLKQCDNSDINGFSVFNLEEVNAEIIANPENYTITFYEEKILAETSASPIPNPTNYTNQTVSIDTVWAKVENDNNCFRVSEVNLVVSTTEIPSTFLRSFYECDDGADITDGVATFDFSLVTDDIKDLFPSGQQLSVKYYQNEADGLSEQNAITDISNYQNTSSPNQQTIYVRVDSQLDNDCLGLGAHVYLHVEKVPVANAIMINPACDNDRDGLYSFDTSTVQNIIVGTQTNVAVTYFDASGVQLSSPLPNPFSTASLTITARIINTASQDPNGSCSDETTFDFVVSSVPIANAVPPQEACDDDADGIFSFDTSNIETAILGGQTGLIVNYFDENDVALSSPLPNPFVSESQIIRVRLENPIYDVCYEETTVAFIVREKPTFDLIEEDIICLTSNPQLEVSIENPSGNNTYSWTDENNIIVSNLPTATLTEGGIYKVIGTSIYGCNSEEQEIMIKESSIANISINNFEIVDDSNNNSIHILNSNIGLGAYEFRLLNEDLEVIREYQDNPFFDNLEGGIYTVEINDKNNCGSVTFEVSLLSFPKFFTPNGDGKNDFWRIKGISKNFYQSGIIKVFNRYGNLVSKFTIDDMGWDGTYNGKILPSNDYWFYIELLDKKNVSRARSGNFSLLRK